MIAMSKQFTQPHCQNLHLLVLPVISPSSLEAWKMEGLSKTKSAWPEVPVLARLRATSGTVGSSTPLMNCIEAASHTWRV
jgi:hypothetical protein